MFLSKTQFLSAVSLKKETVKLPEFGGNVIVQELTAGERDLYEMLLYERGKEGAPKDYMRAALVACSLVDEKGEKLFTLEDVPQISKLSASVIDRIYDVATRISGLTKSEQDKQLKNSESDQSVAS